MALMGYVGAWHIDGAHINIHGGARAMGAEGLRKGLARLSQQARDLVTLENDEAGGVYTKITNLSYGYRLLNNYPKTAADHCYSPMILCSAVRRRVRQDVARVA